jgi:hypothetical protein
LKQVLVDPKHLKAYDLTDGTRTQQQVATGAGISQPMVSGLWGKWRRLGIVLDKNGKTVHIVKPSDYGLEVSEAAATDTRESTQRRPRRGKGAAVTTTVAAADPAAAAADGVQEQ